MVSYLEPREPLAAQAPLELPEQVRLLRAA
jgi:hypothetical protein